MSVHPSHKREVSPYILEDIARLCHEVNRGYCEAIGDNSQKPWERTDEALKNSTRMGVAKALNDPSITPRELHAGWYAHKQAEGWTFGVMKDVEKKIHPCMLAYDELPKEQRTKDYLFKAVVDAMR